MKVDTKKLLELCEKELSLIEGSSAAWMEAHLRRRNFLTAEQTKSLCTELDKARELLDWAFNHESLPSRIEDEVIAFLQDDKGGVR